MLLSNYEETVLSLVNANKDFIKIWLKEMQELAREGNSFAKDLVEMESTQEGQKKIWELISRINQALASCAFEVPADDAEDKLLLSAVVDSTPHAHWVIERHYNEMSLQEINPLLGKNNKNKIVDAEKRLKAWLGI